MLHRIVQDIQTRLSRIEQNAALVVDLNFVERVEALDVLEFRILDRIENVLYEHGYDEELARLQGRAAQVWRQLETVNARLFQRLRQRLVSAHDAPTTLRQFFDAYVGPEAIGNRQDPIGYDCLDVFVDGLLDMSPAPEETKPIVSGMIGYQATPARFVLALVEQVNLTADDVFYDLGSGLGRVTLLLRLLSAAQVKGIEFEPAYCAYAQQRALGLCLSRLCFINIDARQADYTDGTVFFMYTPFTGHMLRTVLDRLHAEARTRPIRIATYGPCTQHVAQENWLELTEGQMSPERDLALFRSRCHVSRDIIDT